MRPAISLYWLAIPVLGFSLTACAPGGAGLDSQPHSEPITGILTMQRIDGLGNPHADAGSSLQIEKTESGLLVSMAAGENGASLFLELSNANEAVGLPRIFLSEALQDQAILLVQPVADDRLQVGLTMIGETALPTDECLLDIRPGSPSGLPQRIASAAPGTPVADLAFNQNNSTRLEWTFYNNGDYDQNGQVTIGDITPLGQHFGKTSAAPDWNVARVADGDLNQANTISDLTPIGVNFGSSVDSFTILESTGFDGPFTAVPGGSVPFSSASQPPGGGPVRFQNDLVNPAVKNYFTVRAHDGISEAAQNSNVVRFDPSNLPPLVVGSHDAGASNPPGVVVKLDISGSSDPDGNITDIQWDIYGTGSFSSAGPILYFVDPTYPMPGTYTPAVRVHDDGGIYTEFSFEPFEVGLTAEQIIPIDNSGQARNWLSAIINGDGQPWVVWTYESGGMFGTAKSRGTSPAAQNFTAPLLSATFPEPPRNFTAVLSDGSLDFFYEHDEDVIFRFDASGTGDSITLSGLLRGNTASQKFGYGVSAMTIVADSVCAYGAKKSSGEYDRIEFSGGVGSFERTISSTAGYRPTLINASPDPAVCFTSVISENNHQLSFVRATASDGKTWGPEVVVVSGEDVETGARSMLLNNGHLLIVYWSESLNALRAVISADLGQTWGEPQTIAADTAVIDRYCLTTVNRLPCVSFADGPDIKVLFSNLLSTEHDWSDPFVVPDAGNVLGRLDMVDREGWPMIFYTDLISGNLHAIRFGP